MPHSKAASMESNSVPEVIDGVVESLRSDYQLESLRPQKGVEFVEWLFRNKTAQIVTPCFLSLLILFSPGG
ncbi:hypothetical protein D5086_033498 [Populus alba]|uniref:Uncharacterized protein n=1 Tax=Populus alba TaxID=43335 RepID=A0ACC4AH13_POPAL